MSFKPFLEAHNPKAFEFFGVPEMREQMIKPDFKAFYEEVGGPHRCASSALPVDTPFDACSHGRAQCVLPGFPNMPPEAVPPGGLLTMLFFGFVNGWWPLRNMPNVLFLHFSEMKVAGYTFASTCRPPARPAPACPPAAVAVAAADAMAVLPSDTPPAASHRHRRITRVAYARLRLTLATSRARSSGQRSSSTPRSSG